MIDEQPDAYRDYQQLHRYEYDPGLLYLPVAASTVQRPCRIRLHGGIGKRVVDWRAAKHHSPPVIPGLRLDRDEDYDTQAELDDDEEAADDAEVRPLDRVVCATTRVALPMPDPTKGSYTYMASGTYTYVEVHEDGPRVPGHDALPTGRRPFYMGRIDDSASESLIGYSPPTDGSRDSLKLADFLNAKEDLTSGVVAWPTTIYSDHFTNLGIFQE